MLFIIKESNPEKRYPLILVAKGKTVQCELKYGKQPSAISIHHESGWSHGNVMKQYLDILASWCKPPLALVLDVYSTHREKSVREDAESLGIKLIFIPASGTGEFQPKFDQKMTMLYNLTFYKSQGSI